MENLITLKNNKVNYICFAVLSGIQDADNNKSGIAHLMEHLAFRKAEEFDQQDIYNISESLGVNLNATTYKNYIKFDFICLKENFIQVIDLFSKMFYEVEYDVEMLEAEKKVVCSEISQRYYSDAEDIISSLWGNTKFSQSILGTEADINKISLDEIVAYKRDFLNNGKHTIFLMGNYDENDIATVERLFGKLLDKQVNSKVKNFHKKEEDIKINFINRKTNSVLIYYAFYYDNSYEDLVYKQLMLKIIDEILFKGNAAYLKKTLREKNGFIYEFESYIDILDNEIVYLFGFEIDYNCLFKAIDILESEINSFVLYEKFLRYVKAFYCNNYDINYDSFINIFYDYVDNYMMFGKVISPKEISYKISEVQCGEVIKFFKDMIKRKNIFVIGNMKKKDKKYLKTLFKY